MINELNLKIQFNSLILEMEIKDANMSMLMLRYWIRDEFTEKLKESCNIRTRQCRGGSKDLYKLILKSPSTYQYLKTDKDHLQIVSGIGHTFIRYKDDEFERYIYIDPTIAQFVPSFDGIFIGKEAELYELIKAPKSTLNITDYIEDPKWTRKTHPPLTIEHQLMIQSAGAHINQKKLKKYGRTCKHKHRHRHRTTRKFKKN